MLRLRMTGASLCSLIFLYLHGVSMLYGLDTTDEEPTVASVPLTLVWQLLVNVAVVICWYVVQ
jgi:hypothetical protein